MKRLAAFLAILLAALPLGVHAQAVGIVTQTFTLTSTGLGPTLVLNGQTNCSIVITGGTSFTIVPQAASDGPTNPQTWNTATTINSGAITAVGTYTGSIATIGITDFGFNVTAIGAVPVTGTESCGPGSGGGGSGGPTTVTNTVTVQPSGGNMQVSGAGASGTPSGGVLTVQGQTGMVPLQVTNNCTSGCIPAAYTYYNIPASTTCSAAVCIIKGSSAALISIINLSTSAQAAVTCTFYDNATAASGQITYAAYAMGAGQVITFGGGQGIKLVNGLTLQCTGAPTGNGMLVLYQ